MTTGDQDGGAGAERGSSERDIRSAAHDLRNLVTRLNFLADTLQRAMPDSAARDEARDLLSDTTRRLGGIAERLREIAGKER